MILEHPTLSESQVKLLVQAADSVYQNQMSLEGWKVITPDLTDSDYGLDPDLITGNVFRSQGDLFNVPYGDANAAVLKSGDNLLLAFRGTEIPQGDAGYWLRLEQHYDLFEPLFQALDKYIEANSVSNIEANSVSKILVTGHSLGGAMAELYMAKHPGSLYSAVTVASPTASNDASDTRILNIGFENDPVYEITSGDPFGVGIGGANRNNSTTNLFLNLDNTGLFGINNHASSEYIYAVERLFDSAYYDQLKRDSFVIVDRKSSRTKVSDVVLSSSKNIFILGEDNKADDITGDQKNDVLEGLGGNDTLKGDKISASFFSGDDILDGGKGNDELDGSGGEDIAIFSDNFENYDYSRSQDGTTITLNHARGTITDGIDTLKNVEFAQFQGSQQEPLGFIPQGGEDEFGNQAFVAADSGSASRPRIIPLPLEDGVEDTEFVEVNGVEQPPYYDPTLTAPNVSLTAPVAMLDGDVDFTLNISPFEQNSEYNIVYIFDRSPSTSKSAALQTTKDAYTDLTNYFVDNGLAENINFSLVSFSRYATIEKDLNADQIIAAIENTTSETANVGTAYRDALTKADQFFLDSALNRENTTNIAYFVSDGRSYPNGFNFNEPIESYHSKAIDLQEFAYVQAFGLDIPLNDGRSNNNPAVASQINYVDSNGGVIITEASELSNEMGKSGLAGAVDSVNILVDGVVVDTIAPEQLTDSPMGLTYEGAVEDLDVSIDAENIITAEVVFNNGLPTTTVDYTVTAGEGKLTDADGNPIDESGNNSGEEDPFERTRNGGDGNDEITLGYVDRGANGGAGGDYIVGNRRDNILDGGVGNDTIIAHEGNDTIITGAGTDKVDGGAGIDTVLYGDVVYLGNSNISLRQAANTVSYNNTDTLTDVEFLQFSDVRISAETLAIFPTLEFSNDTAIEGSADSYTFELNVPAPVDVVFNYNTIDGDAIAGLDYTATSEQVIIPAGETTVTLNIEILEDNLYDETTESFALNINGLTGATFSDNTTETTISAKIENKGRDEPKNLAGDAANNLLVGGSGNDTLNGRGGNDTLNGGDGDDILRGESGNDIIDGGAGIDRIVETANVNFTLTDTRLTGLGIDTLSNIELARLDGGAGNNLLQAGTVTNIEVTLVGAQGNDSLIGGAKADALYGGDGNDRLEGRSGYDSLFGGNGNDALYGGNGFDTLNSGAGDDILRGESGNDTINGGAGTDRIIENANINFTLTDTSLTGLGTDTLSNIELARLDGGAGNNLLQAGAVTNMEVTLVGAQGNDSLIGGAKADALYGGDGNDRLEGRSGYDSLFGGNGNDALYGGNGFDTLDGGGGDDILRGESGNDTINGGAGIDRIIENANVNFTLTDTSLTGLGTDTLSNIELARLDGGAGNNLLQAGAVTNIEVTLVGAQGNDSLIGGAKADALYGSDGNDRLEGRGGYDSLFSGNGNDALYGGNGFDTLNGGAGDDILRGESGNDTLIGGAGADIFILQSVVGTDTISDFNDGIDSIGLNASLGFSDLSITNNSGGTATLIRDTSNNNQLLAIVNNVSAADITVDDFIEV